MDSGTGRRGRLIVISAPSGAGKTSIAQAILARHSSMRFSGSATTRAQRATEVDGKDYFFLTREEFERRIAAGAFAEWEEIYGDLYGTPRSEIDGAREAGEDLLFDIDVKGGLSIKRFYPDAVLIFIQPPSVDVLLDRLHRRQTEDAATLARRMERVPTELALGKEFDYQVTNDVLERAVAEVDEIVKRVMHH
jgi:guanylate kinase